MSFVCLKTTIIRMELAQKLNVFVYSVYIHNVHTRVKWLCHVLKQAHLSHFEYSRKNNEASKRERATTNWHIKTETHQGKQSKFGRKKPFTMANIECYLLIFDFGGMSFHFHIHACILSHFSWRFPFFFSQNSYGKFLRSTK